MGGAGGLAGLLGGGAGGGMIAQVIGNLMKNPAAMQGMMNFMQGRPPTAGIPAPPSQGGAMPMPPGGMPMPPRGGPPMPPGGADTPQPDDAEAMAKQAIDSPDGVWEGTKSPTPADIEKLNARPTDTNVESFDDQFGQGAAAKYMQNDEDKMDLPKQGDPKDYGDKAVYDRNEPGDDDEDDYSPAKK